MVLAAALVLAGCAGDDAAVDPAVTSIPDDTTSTTTTTEPDTVAPDIIPADESLITEEYVEGVLTALERQNRVSSKLTREAGVVGEDTIEILFAIGTEPNAIEGVNSLAELARQGFEGYREDPDPVIYEVIELVEARSTCIVAVVEIDASGIFVDPPEAPPPGDLMVELLPASEEQRASGLNPTAWVIDSIPLVGPGDDAPDCDVTQR